MANQGSDRPISVGDLQIFAAEVLIGAGCGLVSQFLKDFWPTVPPWIPSFLFWVGLALIALGFWQIRRLLVALPTRAWGGLRDTWRVVRQLRIVRADAIPDKIGRPTVTVTNPVEFTVEGKWLNTPFQFGHIAPKNALTQRAIYCEDAYLTFKANTNLEGVRIQFVASVIRGPEHEHWPRRVFADSVTQGMTETIRFFRRTFRYDRIAVRNEDGQGHSPDLVRREVDVVLFDGTPDEVSIPKQAVTNIDVHVHHKGGPTSIGVTMDTNLEPAPKSRLYVYKGDVKLPINYEHHLGATVTYEDLKE